MKEEMRHRFVPTNYVRSLYDKLTNLKQWLKTVDGYLYDMELIMQRARVREPEEQTMQLCIGLFQDCHTKLGALFVTIHMEIWPSYCINLVKLKLWGLRRRGLRRILW